MMSGYHIGRHWPSGYRKNNVGATIEDNCPCEVEPCGLVSYDKIDPDCPQHGPMAAKTIRTSHAAEDCPGQRA
jgi:hypothetical protein